MWHLILYKRNNSPMEKFSWRGALDTTLCNESFSVNTGRSVFYPGPPVSSTNTTESRESLCTWDIVENGVKLHNPNLQRTNDGSKVCVSVYNTKHHWVIWHNPYQYQLYLDKCVSHKFLANVMHFVIQGTVQNKSTFKLLINNQTKLSPGFQIFKFVLCK